MYTVCLTTAACSCLCNVEIKEVTDMKRLMKAPVWGVLMVACMCCAVPMSAAFLASKDSASNVFTAGYNESYIEERFGSYREFKVGESYEKNVAVKNDGSVPCYVRMLAEIEDPDMADSVTIDFNDDDWTEKQPDGFYYYRKTLPASEITSPLFTNVKANADMTGFRMICYSETVQAEGSDNAIDAFTAL